jgi:hypothetical protein
VIVLVQQRNAEVGGRPGRSQHRDDREQFEHRDPRLAPTAEEEREDRADPERAGERHQRLKGCTIARVEDVLFQPTPLRQEAPQPFAWD